MKKIYLLLLVATLLCLTSIHAQVTVTGSTGANGTYTSLTQAGGAFAAINAAGVQTGNAILITITADVSTEDGVNSLNNGGWSTLTINPSGTRTVSGSVALAMINLNGASNVTIDGLNSGGNSLTISNASTSATSGTSTIRLIADASNNLITRCTILGSSTMALGTNGGTIYFATGTTNGNDNNTISSCDIGPAGGNLPTKGIYANGSTGSAAIRNSGNLISGNNIYDFFNATTSVSGVHILSGNDLWIITGNRLYQTGTRTFTGTALRYAGITINSTAGTLGSFTVTSNVIGFGASNGTGTTTILGSTNEFRGIDALSVNTTTTTYIQSNVISGINQTSARNSTSNTAGCFTGINMGAGTDGLFDVSYNNIGSQDGSSTVVINATSTTASTTGVIGILDFSLRSNTIASNGMGAITINSGGSGTTTGFKGIFVITNTGLATTITNNFIGGTGAGAIIDNISGAYTITGILSALPNATITGNTIRNITSNATGTGSVGLCGINAQQSTGTSTISQNTIHSLTNNAGSSNNSIYALLASLSTVTSNIVERNFVHSITLNASVTTGQLVGIIASAGSGTYKNNMVRLGIDASGSSQTLGVFYAGMWLSSATANNNFYNNSVYLAGTGVVSVSNTYAFYSTTTGVARDIRNNIFWNARSNASGGIANFAIRLGGTSANPTGLTTNYNDLYATGVDGYTGYFNSAFRNTLPDWQTGTGQDANSFAYNPHFVNRSGTASTIDLHITSITPIEGTGVNIASVTDDFDGQARSGLTPNDVGADAGAFTYGIYDEDAPVITYTNLPNATCTSVNPVLSAVITDVISGVNTTTGTLPRIYYKKSTNANVLPGTNDNTTDGWKYTEATNTSSPFTLTVDYALIFGGVATGDNIQYFVVAQDLASPANVGINSGTLASTPASVALTGAQFPVTGTINSFNLVSGIPTYVTIGAAGTYTTLTGAGGLFAAINTNGLSGNTIAEIVDATVTETGANSLNPIASGCSGTPTLTIRPGSGVSPTLSGANATALINFNGASYVTIDGSNNGTSSKNLTISNTNTTGPVLLLSNGAGSNVIKNSILQGVTTSYGVLTLGSSSGITGNSNNVIQNNDITRGTTRPVIGVYNIGALGKPNTSNVISGNRIMDFSTYGFCDGNGTGAGYSSNTQVAYNEIFQNTTGATTAMTGIITNHPTGITGMFLYKNYIHDLQTTSTGTIVGIDLYDAGAGTIQVNNNMIALSNTTGNLRGIAHELGISASANIYYNTVSVYGTTTGTYASFSFLKNFTAIGDNIKNNIFSNTRLSSGSGNQYGISTTTVATYTSDYNDIYSSGNARNIFGSAVSIDQASIAAWRTATSGDANSVNVLPVFMSATNLHLTATDNCGLDGKATPISITTDIDDNPRDASTPDIGADEFTGTPSTTLAGIVSSTVCDNRLLNGGTNFTNSSCGLIARVVPSGASPAAGTVNACVYIDPTVPPTYNAEPYVQRHIDITPSTNPATSTGRVTLYFTDAEFTTFNANNAAWPDLPTVAGGGNSDPNIANLRVSQYHGSPLTSPSSPNQYSTGTAILIDPADADVVWNGSYWAVSFDVTGFSGFYVHTNLRYVLPIEVNYFRGSKQGGAHLLDWKLTCNSTPTVKITLERSSSSNSGFTGVYSTEATAARCNQPFNYTDVQPLPGMNYYRVKMVDANGKITYSGIVALLNATKGFDIVSIAPNPVVGSSFKLNATAAQASKMDLVIIDMQGRIVQREQVSLGSGFSSTEINVARLNSGTYSLYGVTADGRSSVLRFVKQ